MSKTLIAIIAALVVILAGLYAFETYQDLKAGREIAQKVETAQSSLFTRLGGKAAVEAVTDDFLGQLVAAPRFERFFKGAPPEVIAKVRNHVVDQLCEATGGPCRYTGRDMRTVHKGMRISEQEWSATVDMLQNSLDKFRVPQREQEELKAIVGSTRADIVE